MGCGDACQAGCAALARLLRTAGVLLTLAWGPASVAVAEAAESRSSPSTPVASGTTAVTPSRLVLWAWTPSVDLGFLGGGVHGAADADVAVLAGEILVGPDGVQVRPRSRGIRLPRSGERTATVYLQVSRQHRRALTDSDISRLASAIRAMPLVRDAHRLQLNFEAVESRRDDWQRLVDELRARMPRAQALDAAVLAAWCMEPDFRPPGVERVVPMLYRLGPTSPALSAVIAGDAVFPAESCRSALGVTTDERLPRAGVLAACVTHLYVFTPEAWTSDALQSVRSGLRSAGWFAETSACPTMAL